MLIHSILSRWGNRVRDRLRNPSGLSTLESTSWRWEGDFILLFLSPWIVELGCSQMYESQWANPSLLTFWSKFCLLIKKLWPSSTYTSFLNRVIHISTFSWICGRNRFLFPQTPIPYQVAWALQGSSTVDKESRGYSQTLEFETSIWSSWILASSWLWKIYFTSIMYIFSYMAWKY